MSLTKIIRAQTALGIRDQIVDLVTSRKKYSENFYTAIRARLPRLYDLWRGIYTGRFHPHKNNVHIPLIFSVIWSDAARKMATSYSDWPVVHFEGYGPDDAPIARKREGLISAQMKDLGMYMKGLMGIVQADLYGTNISQVMWRHDEQEQIFKESKALPLSGKIVQIKQQKRVTTFDGPDIENVDRLDFFPAPGFRDIQTMPWCVRRFYLELDAVRALASGDNPVFDMAEVRRLEAEGYQSTEMEDGMKSLRSNMPGLRGGQFDALMQDKYYRGIEILEMWGLVPSELAPDGVTMRVVTVANQKFLMRNEGLPFWHGEKPFVVYSPQPDPHYFDAPGKAEVAEKLQIVANRFTNQTLDATDLFIDPVFIYDRMAGINTRNLAMRPGRFFGIDGSPGDKIMPLVPNLSGVALGTQKTQEMWAFMQQGTGIIEDTVMGGQGPDRQTLGEYQGRAESAATRLTLESRIYEELYLEPLANMMVDLDKQLLTTPREIMILGQSAMIDPVTGSPIQNRELLTGYDLMPNYAAHAVGATTRLSKQMRQQNMIALLQAIQSNPQTAAMVNWINFFRQTFSEFGMDNVNELLMTMPQMQQAMGAMGVENPAAIPNMQAGMAGGEMDPNAAQG